MKQLVELERLGALSVLDVELARALTRLAPGTSDDVALAVALASRELSAGHVCADLARSAGTCIVDDGDADGLRFPMLEAWRETLHASALVSTHGLDAPARPLVLDGDRLYLARYYEHERAIAARLRALATSPVADVGAPPALAAQLFPRASTAPDLQRDAALAARTRRFSVIVGGPGTGKTSTVVKLLALLVHDALAAGKPPPRSLLVAPTGKAAQRLSEAITRARESLAIDDAVKRGIETRASTLHRALGPVDGSLTRFRHDASRPLACDLVLLDEASMVDLALMRRFLDAVPDGARVILLGDPDQLASVEAGGVLHDICRAAEQPDSALAGCVSRLRESYRYPKDSGIAKLAAAVHAQRLDDVLAIARAGLPDVACHPTPPPRELGRALEREVRSHYADLRARTLATRLDALDHFRVLCAHRRGPASVEQLNPAISRALGRRDGRLRESYPGRPVIITENDYATSLFNGDVGVLHAQAGPKRELMACFRESAERVREISVGRLPTHESAYAMTVHKSQGSEFDHVAIVLPERPSRILSRELLYTAITRAKRSVSVYASEASLASAVLQRVERSSGLVMRLT
ncbi:MAG: exodeoxyribonuclease V subunit alpha [Polyangiales bacterium]